MVCAFCGYTRVNNVPVGDIRIKFGVKKKPPVWGQRKKSQSISTSIGFLQVEVGAGFGNQWGRDWNVVRRTTRGKAFIHV